MKPLCSVITPSRRGGDGLERCILSVANQTYPNVEHIVVGDLGAIDPGDWDCDVRFFELNDLWRTPTTTKSTGSWPWFIGTQFAKGEFITFLGDDDEYLPRHVEAHVEALEESGADYSLSKVAFHVSGEFVMNVGDGTVRITHLDSDGIMGRRENFRRANWLANGSDSGDFDLVFRWHSAGMSGVFVDEVTAIHNDGWLAKRPDIVALARSGRDWRTGMVVNSA